MPSIENRLPENRKIIYRAKLHWAVLLGPTFLIFMGWLSMESQGLPSVVLIAFGFIWGAFSTISLCQSDILLTNNQLEINVGFPLKRSYNIPLDTITLTNFYQPSLGAMLNFGKIMIVQNGAKKTVFRFIARPAEFVKEVQETLMTTRHHQQPSPSITE